jgi:hypothetical protein
MDDFEGRAGTVLISRTNAATAGVTDTHALASGALSGFHVAFLLGAVLVAVAAMLGLLIHDEDAASTMQPRLPWTDPEPRPVPQDQPPLRR